MPQLCKKSSSLKNTKKKCCTHIRISNRVQWFWHFLKNSICFMCFWFGLEILRLCYKKAFFEILNDFLSYLTFYPPKKVAPPLLRAEKNFFEIGRTGIKRSGILRWFQKCAEVLSLAKRKKNLQKNWFLRDLENLAKKCFFWEKISWNFLTQEFYTFLKSAQNSASFDTLWAQFWRYFFKTPIRDGAIILEVKRSNKIETVQYFKKASF
jgi:hypothetical protein